MVNIIRICMFLHEKIYLASEQACRNDSNIACLTGNLSLNSLISGASSTKSISWSAAGRSRCEREKQSMKMLRRRDTCDELEIRHDNISFVCVMQTVDQSCSAYAQNNFTSPEKYVISKTKDRG